MKEASEDKENYLDNRPPGNAAVNALTKAPEVFLPCLKKPENILSDIGWEKRELRSKNIHVENLDPLKALQPGRAIDEYAIVYH